MKKKEGLVNQLVIPIFLITKEQGKKNEETRLGYTYST